jgi:hypothetical protein
MPLGALLRNFVPLLVPLRCNAVHIVTRKAICDLRSERLLLSGWNVNEELDEALVFSL